MLRSPSLNRRYADLPKPKQQDQARIIARELVKEADYVRFYWDSGLVTTQSNHTGKGLFSGTTHNIQHRIVTFLKSCFLPDGYPQSVRPDYKTYYTWSALQGIAGSASYVISTKALLTSVGIGAPLSIPGAAAISWVLKDGLGSLGMMFVASRLGKRFDSDTKRNKWRADLLHNVGVGLELITPLIPSYFLLFASMANVAKGLAGITAGATRASLNKHFCLAENLGDVTAKAQTQGIATYLTGMCIGIGISLIPVNSPGSPTVFGIFGVLAGIHIYSSYRALSSVNLRTLNMQRTSLLIDEYIEKQQVSGPDVVKKQEAIIVRPKFIESPKVILGSTIKDAISSSTLGLKQLLHLFTGELYMLAPGNQSIHILLKEDIDKEPIQILKSYFNGYYLRSKIIQSNSSLSTISKETIEQFIKESLQFTNDHFQHFIQLLHDKNWTTSHLLLLPHDNRFVQLPS